MQADTFKSIMQMAINNEIEARDFYQGVLDKVVDASLKDVFSDLAKAEQGHKELLEGFLNNADLPLKFKDSADYKVAGTIERPALSVGMKPVDGIALAIKKEEDAMLAYQQLADNTDDQELKGLFAELSRMELGHKTRLEDLYSNMAFPEVW